VSFIAPYDAIGPGWPKKAVVVVAEERKLERSCSNLARRNASRQVPVGRVRAEADMSPPTIPDETVENDPNATLVEWHLSRALSMRASASKRVLVPCP
jgi:hypothetical protein